MVGRTEPWISQYRPKKTSEIFGQEKQIKALKEYVAGYKKQKKKSCLLYGPPGCGKTTTVLAIANEMNAELFELNASDYRNKAAIEDLLGNALKQQSLFFSTKIILVDEVDGVSGTKDRGGVGALLKTVSESGFPVILTANNIFDQKFKDLRKKCHLIEFDMLHHEHILGMLKRICEGEGISYDEKVLKMLSRRCGGDLRGAVNDLQLLSSSGGKITIESLEELSERDQTTSMEQALLKVFKGSDENTVRFAFDDVPDDMDSIFMWIDENLPVEYTQAQDLSAAYDMVSRADIFRGRIRRWQHWRFMVYIYALLSVGVNTAKREKYKTLANYKQSERPLKMWFAKMRYGKKKSIAEKIAAGTHSSTKSVMKDVMPYVQVIFKKNKAMSDKMVEQFELEDEEVAWLMK